MLTSYCGQTITYDETGNPLSYYNGQQYTFTWENGRRLAAATVGGTNLTFTYNDEGIRTTKTVGTVAHVYHLNGAQIVFEEYNNTLLVYLYDAEGSPIGMQYRMGNGNAGVFEEYWFEKNLQGDIVAVYDGEGTKLISYTYDAWGNFITNYHNGCTASSHANLNPFRYRGYYYDTELGMYYLQSRYYDPAVGRFLNADVYISTGQGLLGNNMFAYCNNNLVNAVDPLGEDAIWLQDSNAVWLLGHTGLLIQDDNGVWYHFYWGSTGLGSLGKSGATAQVDVLKDFSYSNLEQLNEYLREKNIYSGKYEFAIYFEGDFGDSVAYAEKLQKNYNLIWDNCMQLCIEVLLEGTFKQSNKQYRSFLNKISLHPVPNYAYTRLRNFDEAIERYHETPWYWRILRINPITAAIIF